MSEVEETSDNREEATQNQIEESQHDNLSKNGISAEHIYQRHTINNIVDDGKKEIEFKDAYYGDTITLKSEPNDIASEKSDETVSNEYMDDLPEYNFDNDLKKPLLGRPKNSEANVFTYKEIIMISVKQMFLITLSALPVVIIVSLAGFGYSRLKWTRKPSILSHNNEYFNRKVMFWFDDVMRTVLIASLNVIVGCVLYNRTLLKSLLHLLTIALPVSVMGSIAFYFIYKYTTPYFIWFYYIDIVIFMLVFFIVVGITQLILSKSAIIPTSEVFTKYVLPMYAMALGIGFVDIYFSKTYRIEKDGSLLKYAQRLVVYPIIMDSFLGCGEFFVRRIEGASVQGQAHSLYLIQVRFGILGRYMNLSVGSLSQLVITCTVVMIKEIIFHRMGRIQCWLFYKFRRFFTKKESSTEEFRKWYFEKRFREFRACVLNNDLLHEFTATMVTPFLLYFFQRHRLLFRFDDDLFVHDDRFNPQLFVYQLCIQLVFLFLTYIAIIFIEGRYNGVDLRVAFSKRSLLQEISQVVIYLWGMLQILSAVRVVPNYFQCDNENICTCRFSLNKTVYGCTQNSTLPIQWEILKNLGGISGVTIS